MIKQFKGSQLRKGRFSQNNQIYLITSVTSERNPIFYDFNSARMLIKCFRQCQNENKCESLCWVVMPDHFHWLVQLNLTSSLPQLLKLVKGRFSYSYSKLIGKQNTKVWQSGYHDRAIRKDEDLKSVARYIVANPLRAKIVKNIGNYPHWDSVWL